MTTQRVTIELPEPIFHQLQRIAAATHQSIEELVAQSVISNLPPSVENASADMQLELLNMQTLTIEELQAIAHVQVEPDQHERHMRLLEKNEQDLLTLDEQQELTNLRQAADRLMLRKAYAWSTLRWRGHRLSALEGLPAVL